MQLSPLPSFPTCSWCTKLPEGPHWEKPQHGAAAEPVPCSGSHGTHGTRSGPDPAADGAHSPAKTGVLGRLPGEVLGHRLFLAAEREARQA